MKNKSALQRLMDSAPKQNQSTAKVSSFDYKKFVMYSDFLLNINFIPVRYELDKKIDDFFTEIRKYNRNSKFLEKFEGDVRDIFYSLFYNQIKNDSHLRSTISGLSESFVNIGPNEDSDSQTDLLLKKLNRKITLNLFMPIIDEIFVIPNIIFRLMDASYNEIKKVKDHLLREKDLLHKALDEQNSPDKRVPKLKCEDYINEYLKINKDINPNKTELAKDIRRWILSNYPAMDYSVTTIRPKLSKLL